eukprot:Nk52_evm51s2192 gene=Nk52_evmTU51s2192
MTNRTGVVRSAETVGGETGRMKGVSEEMSGKAGRGEKIHVGESFMGLDNCQSRLIDILHTENQRFVDALKEFSWFSVLFEYSLLPAGVSGYNTTSNRKVKNRNMFELMQKKFNGTTGKKLFNLLYEGDVELFFKKMCKCDCNTIYLEEEWSENEKGKQVLEKKLRNKKNCKENVTCLHRLGEHKVAAIAECVRMGIADENEEEEKKYGTGLPNEQVNDAKAEMELFWTKAKTSFVERLREDPSDDIRDKNKQALCGLKNFGTTCYVNTLLQVWFHIEELRNAIYKWGNALKKSGIREESSVRKEVEKIFCFLQLSKRWFFAPEELIDLLSLSKGEQQDAQEFSKLLMQLLIQEAKKHDSIGCKAGNSLVSESLEELCFGKLCYSTICSQCKSVSKRFADFGELELALVSNATKASVTESNEKKNGNGKKRKKRVTKVDLMNCIKEFLCEEKMDGNNQYMCEVCKNKQDAIRKIELQKLPPVLNLQLMRFVYECKDGEFKKVKDKTLVQFPEILDLSDLVEGANKETKQENEDCHFSLKAIMMHNGPSAYSGHYTAIVKDGSEKGVWYKCDDESIKPMQSLNVADAEDSGSDGELQEEVATKKKKVSSDSSSSLRSHVSKNAYTLVYVKKERNKKMDENVKPDASLSQLVMSDNLKLQEASTQYKESLVCELEGFKCECVEKFKLFQNMIITGGTGRETKSDSFICEFLPTAWIRKWLTSSSTPDSVDTSCVMCPHNMLNPQKLQSCKMVHSCLNEDYGHVKYNGGPKLVVDFGRASTMLQGIQSGAPIFDSIDAGKIVSLLRQNGPDGVNGALCLQCTFNEFCYPFIKKAVEDLQKELSKTVATEYKNDVKDKNMVFVSARNIEVFLDYKVRSDALANMCWKSLGCSQDFLLSTAISLPTALKLFDIFEGKIYGDLLCEHGGIKADSVEKTLVPKDVGQLLSLFMSPSGTEMKAVVYCGVEEPVCSECLARCATEKSNEERLKEDARLMEAKLGKVVCSALSKSTQTKRWSQWVECTSAQTFFVIDKVFAMKARSYFKNPMSKAAPCSKDLNSSALCSKHNLFQEDFISLCGLKKDETEKDETYNPESDYSLLVSDEWKLLDEYFQSPPPLTLVGRGKNRGGVPKGNLTRPELCGPCCEAKSHLRLENEKAFTEGILTVVRIDGATLSSEAIANQASDSLSGKKRRRRPQGTEKRLNIASTDCLSRLRLSILDIFEILPSEQNLYFEGNLLTRASDDKSLAELNFKKHSTLFLHAPDTKNNLDEALKTSAENEGNKREGGFSGTNLLSS